MTGWLTALRDRPIAEQERHTTLAATAAVLIAAALLLALTRPATQAATARSATKASTPAGTVDPSPRAPETSPRGALSREAVSASRAFLAGYLAYTYGSAPASRITDAASSLIASLEAHPPRVTPAMRASRPHVLELDATPGPSSQLGITAVVNAGGLINYKLGLSLTSEHRRLLVTAVEQD
jgi:hypothetical protein